MERKTLCASGTWLAGLLLAALLSACASVPSQSPAESADIQTPSDPYREQLDALAKPYIDGQYIVGMSVGILTPNRQDTYFYGVTGRDGSAPTADTLYEIGSITKTMTGLLLADGVVRGRFELDTPVEDLLGGKAAVDRRITLRRLSTHTSGLPRVPSNFFAYNMTDPYRGYDEKKLLAYLDSPTTISEPGTHASYSNLGVGLLGYALATEAGTTYPRLLRKRALDPLGMNDTTITLSDAQSIRTATPHNADGEPVSLWTLEVLDGAGGVRSTLSDMLIYARAQLEPQRTPLRDAILLSQQSQIDPGKPTLGRGMGLGWFRAADGAWISHGGQTGGFHCSLTINFESGTAVVVLTNTASDMGSQFAQQVSKLIAGASVAPANLSIPAEVPQQVLESYTGQYTILGQGTITITREDDRLYAQVSGQPRLRLYASDEDSFRYRVVEAAVDFERETTGEVAQLVLQQNGEKIVCVRLDETP